MRCRRERSPRWPCSSRATRRALSPARQSTPSAPQIHCSEAEAAASGDAGFIADGLHRSSASCRRSRRVTRSRSPRRMAPAPLDVLPHLTDIIDPTLRVADLGSREVRNWDLALVDRNRALWPTYCNFATQAGGEFSAGSPLRHET